MTQTTFIHAGDLHLGASFKGLLSTAGEMVAGRFIEAVPQSFDRIIELCITNHVDFLILSGDTFNEGEASYRIEKRFLDGMARLAEKGIEVYLCTGNHDPSPTWRKRIPILPKNVHVFPVDKPGYFSYFRGGTPAESGSDTGGGAHELPLVMLIGQSYQTVEEPRDLLVRFPCVDVRPASEPSATAANAVEPADAPTSLTGSDTAIADAEETVSADALTTRATASAAATAAAPAAATTTAAAPTAATATAPAAATAAAPAVAPAAASVRAAADRPAFLIGVLHTGLDDARYAPCSKEELKATGYDYWALGHIHQKGQVGKLDAWYPGTPQGLDINENTGHGCYLVQLTRDTAESGVDVQTTFLSTERIAWEQPVVDISKIENVEALTDELVSLGNTLLSKHRIPVSMRITLTGRTPLHSYLKQASDVRELCDYVEGKCTAGDLWLRIDDVEDATSSVVDLSLIREENLFPATLLEEADSLGADRRSTQIVVREALSKRAVGSLSDSIDLDEALLRARDICLDMLVGGDE